ncbi:hypothetical protein EXN66_Car013187 [Channa argus]|uniref:Uncharacterized protein n=1 Tax=Channa argus TaxID=215402 RepID=A0A6G1Q4S5_CHAAH|nr:hypothetical protein EXN66_Car013187 [Channa argus]
MFVKFVQIATGQFPSLQSENIYMQIFINTFTVSRGQRQGETGSAPADPGPPLLRRNNLKPSEEEGVAGWTWTDEALQGHCQKFPDPSPCLLREL